MAATRWIFTKEHLQNTPSRKSGIDDDKELSYRQQAANLIQDMGQRLAVTQLCINTAIVYMHRFYMLRSFARFTRNEIAPACIFLAAKVEEQPKKLEVVIKVAHTCLNTPFPDIKSEAYLEQAQQLVNNENTLLKTLGFEVTVDHPHTHVVKVTNLVKASKDLSQTSYYLATNSLHMTMFCLQYKPTEVACACIYLASKWSMYKIPRSNEGREWWQYVDPSITLDLLEEIKTEFLNILDKYPSKLKKRIMGGWKGTKEEGGSQSSPQHCDPNRPLSSTSAAYHKYTNHDRNEISDPRKQSINKPNKHPQEANKQDIVEFDKMCILLGKHGVEASKHDGDTSKHNVSEIIKHGIESNKHGSEVSKHGPDSGRHPHYDPKHLIDRVGQLEHSKVERKDLLADKKFTERKEMAAYLDRNLLPNPAHDQKLVTKDESISSRRKEGHPLRPVEIPAGHDRKDALSLTKEPSCNGKPHSSSSQQSTLAPLNIKLHLETVQDSSVVKNEPKPTVTMTALPSQLGAPINSVEMRRVKSETAINYKEYLKRKEQEKLLPQKTVENSANMNNTFSECNSRDRKYPPLKLGTSLPIVNNLHEQQTNNKEIMERPYEVNIKSPIKPHYNITVKSPIKSSDLKQPKLEISKMQITPEKDSSDPFSVNVNTDPYFRKLMAGMKSELCYLSDSDRVLATTMNGEVPHSVKNGFNTNEKLDIESKIRPTHESHELFDSSDLDISLKPEHSAAPNVKIKELGFDPDMGFASSAALKYSKLESGNCKLTPIPSQIKPDTNSDTNTPVTLKLTGQSNNISPLKIKISTIGVPLDSDQCSREHLPSRHKHKHKDKHRSHKHSHESKRHRDKHREKSLSTGTTADVINGQSQPLKLNIKLSDLPNHSSASNESLSVKQKHLTHISKHRASDTTSNKQYVVLSDPAVSNNNLADSLERQQPWSVSDLKTNPQSSQQEQLTSWKRRHAPTSDKNEQSSNPKAAKMAVKRLRRSSSSHSVVSMEMSDGEEGHTNGPMIQAINPPHVVNQIQERLQSLIAQTKEKVQSLQLQQQQQRKHVIRQRSHASHSSPFEAFNVVNRQQSGFDLDSAMWIGRGGDQPPLPPSMLTPPPPPPEQIVRPPLPPNH